MREIRRRTRVVGSRRRRQQRADARGGSATLHGRHALGHAKESRHEATREYCGEKTVEKYAPRNGDFTLRHRCSSGCARARSGNGLAGRSAYLSSLQ